MIEIARIHSADDPRFDALVRIYAEALPPSACKTADALQRMIARPEYFFLAAMEDDIVLGFAIAIAFIHSDTALLEYMAVDATRRGQGLGEMLFRATAGVPDLRSRFLLVEIDAEFANETAAAIGARRKAFYRRLGCRQIEGLTYRMPQVSSAHPPLMDLLVYGDRLPGSIAKPRLRAWLTACYTQVYGQAADDPRISTMLNALPETIRLI